jgi:hypothetical protein
MLLPYGGYENNKGLRDKQVGNKLKKMHYKLHKELSVQTALLQFYCFLTRGFFLEKDFVSDFDYGNENIEKIHSMSNPEKWDGDYSVIIERISKTKEIVTKAKSYLKWHQKCDNVKIAEYMYNHPEFLWSRLFGLFIFSKLFL